MGIWFAEDFSVEDLNQRIQGTLAECVGFRFTEVGADYLKGRIPVDTCVLQPLHLVHGATQTILGETLASYAANLCIDRSRYYGLAVQTHTYLLAPVDRFRHQWIEGVARPIRLGNRLHFWQVWNYASDGTLCATVQVTVVIRSNDELTERPRTYQVNPSQ